VIDTAIKTNRSKALFGVLRLIRRNGWTVSVYGLLGILFVLTFIVHPRFGAYELRSLAIAALPIGLAAVGETIVVLAAGIDLSVGALMSVANVLAASMMVHATFEQSLGIAVIVLAATTAAGFLNGLIIVLSRIPDIVVTLAMMFVWSGVALIILNQPGGGAPPEFLKLGTGMFISRWIPNAIIVLILFVGIVWVPIRSRPIGLSIYATGSDEQAAIHSGVNVVRARLVAYALLGLFSGAGGLAMTMSMGVGDPLGGSFFLLPAIAATVLGGVDLAGGRGGMLGPLAAAYILAIIPMDLVFLGVDTSYGQVINGTIMVLVVMAGGFASFKRSRR
jgi:ribose transport system permease protein